MFNDTKLRNEPIAQRSNGRIAGTPSTLHQFDPIWITIATILRNSPYHPRIRQKRPRQLPGSNQQRWKMCTMPAIPWRFFWSCWWAAPERKNVKCSESLDESGIRNQKKSQGSTGSTGQPLWTFESDLKHFESFTLWWFLMFAAPLIFCCQPCRWAAPARSWEIRRIHPRTVPKLGGFWASPWSSIPRSGHHLVSLRMAHARPAVWERTGKEAGKRTYITTFWSDPTIHSDISDIPPYPDILSD